MCSNLMNLSNDCRYGDSGEVAVDYFCCVNTEGQTGFIIEPVYLAMRWCGVFNHTAGNMSIVAYAQLGACVPSNCKQMLYWAHMIPIQVFHSLFLSLLIPVSLSLGHSAFVCML